VASSAARARLALLDGDVEAAEAVARSVIEELRTSEVEILVAGALVVLARALLAADRLDEAGHEVADAIVRAEGLGERRVLWEALALSADLHDRRGALEAPDLRTRARAIVDEIVAGLPEPDLRRRFLARDVVRALEGRLT
jgi:hypothetical protein